MENAILKFDTVVTPGLLHFGIFFLRFFANFRKNTPKNTKTEKMPGLLHFFDIFCNSPGVTTVLYLPSVSFRFSKLTQIMKLDF